MKKEGYFVIQTIDNDVDDISVVIVVSNDDLIETTLSTIYLPPTTKLKFVMKRKDWELSSTQSGLVYYIILCLKQLLINVDTFLFR